MKDVYTVYRAINASTPSHLYMQSQMSYAQERAEKCDQLYTALKDKVESREEAAQQQGNIRSEVEAVKEQMEEHKVRTIIHSIAG